MGRRARRWLFFVGLAACGIDARGQLDAISATAGDGGSASSGGSSGASSSGSSGDDGGGEGDADVDGGNPGDGSTSRGRVTNGLIALYEFEENGGAVAKDTSGVAPALELGIPSTVTWMPNAIRFDVAAHVKTSGAATKIVSRCTATNAITIEAWIRYVNLPDWSRVVALSQSADVGNAAMTSNPATIGFDLRTSTDAYLRSTRDVYDAGTPTGLVHIVETRGASAVKRVYLNGALVLDVTQDGGLSAWDPSFPLSIGNTPNLDRPFYGEVHLVAFYDRALSAAEVTTNRTAGADP